MRPLQLIVRAFGPYAGEQRFDFEQLGERSLFLICGPTGSGKSTVLDGLCFALYAETSGGERTPADIRSQWAPPEQRTEVELVFAKGAERYRVVRCPRQDRPKKRGPGTTVQDAEASLERLETAGGLDVWKALAAGWAEVTARIEQLLGFRAAQFRQVVVLPQGQFRSLLSAGSKEREDILATLFGTEAYARIQEALKQRTKSALDGIDRLDADCKVLLQEEGVEDRAGLSALAEEVSARWTELGDSISAFEDQERIVTAERDQAIEGVARFSRLDQTLTELSELERLVDANAQREERLQAAHQAHGLADLWNDLLHRRSEGRTTSEARAVAGRDLQTAIREQQQAALIYEQQQAATPQREQARRDAERLTGLREKVADLAAARARLSVADKRLADCEAELASLQQQQAALRAQLDDVERELRQCCEAAGQLDVRRLERERAERALSIRRAQQAVCSELQTVDQQLSALVTRIEHQEREVQQQREHLADLQRDLVTGQAAVLAKDLQPGAACPVCGSRDHPAPAPSHLLPDLNAIDACDQALIEAEADLAELRQEETARRTARARLAERQENSDEQLGEWADRSVEDLTGLAHRAVEVFGQAEQASQRVKSMEPEQSRLQGLLNTFLEKVEASQGLVQTARDGRSDLAGVVREREAAIPAEFREPQALAAAIGRTEEQARQLATAFEQAREDRERTGRDLAARRRAFELLEQEAQRAQQALADKQAAFEQRRQEAGLADQAAFENAWMEPGELQAAEQALRAFQTRLAALRQQAERDRQAIEGLARPDLEAVEARLARVKKELSTVLAARGATGDRLAKLSAKSSKLDECEQEKAKLDAQHGLLGELAEVACDRAMSFERWVLAALLDEVLAAASQRLLTMSRNRYQLRRDLGQRDGRRVGGLDLVVFDAHTGAERSVASLSGGEGFLAALSLALGLADVVCAHAGGIRLETVFVDEGFGSLDPEALDLAFDALAGLRSEGRLVGLISHVPELVERIDARLEIKPGPRGSTARFVL